MKNVKKRPAGTLDRAFYSPLEPDRDDYRSPEIDVFEAHDEFRLLYLAGVPVTCGDLRPALGDAAHLS